MIFLAQLSRHFVRFGSLSFLCGAHFHAVRSRLRTLCRSDPSRCGAVLIVTKGSLGYLSSMYFSTSLVLGEVGGPFPEIESRESRTET